MASPRHRLIRRREELGLTRAKVAEALRYDVTAYAKLEQGKIMMRVGRRPALARVLEWTPAQLALALDGEDPDGGSNGYIVPPWLGPLAGQEQAAAEIRAFEPVVNHGLLQTDDYATAVESVGPYSDHEVAEKVHARLARQAVLTRQPDPLRLYVILDESVLLRPAGTNAVMAAQLEHLVELSDMLNVTLQVMPLSSAVFPAYFGAFALLTSPGADEPYMGYVKDGTGPHYIDRPYDIAHHVELFAQLVEAALSQVESVDRIRRISKERYL